MAELMKREPGEPAIEMRDLRVEMGGVEILAGINAAVREGEITALIGPNGAGKTTLLLAVLGVTPYRGRIIIRSNKRGSVLGYVPQYLDFDRGMPATVMDLLCLAGQRSPVWVWHQRSMKKRALVSLSWVEAEHLAWRSFGNLSGGELQRVLLAMALIEDPDIILLDEPASAVDRSGEEVFMNLVQRLHREKGITFLMVSHDITMVTRLAHQVICLNRMVLSEGKSADVINEKTLSACFGSDKGILTHDHHWGRDLSCAYEPEDEQGPPEGE